MSITISSNRRGTTIRARGKDALALFDSLTKGERFVSHARWPLDVYRVDGGVSTDTHRTREEAQHVCDALKRDGFGGQRQHFPIETWVTEKLA